MCKYIFLTDANYIYASSFDDFILELKFLELVHLPDSPLTLTKKSCKQGFALAPKLTSLKLENFGVRVFSTIKLSSLVNAAKDF